MYSGQLVFFQVMDFMPLKTSERCVAWQLQRQARHLYGPIPDNGLRTTGVSRESTGYRSLPSSAEQQALSHRHPR